MSKFTFSLDPLLKARVAAEREHQRAVAVIEVERQVLEQRLKDQQNLIAEGKLALKDGLVGAVDAANLRQHAASSLHAMRLAQRMALELHGVHRRLHAARTGLVEAARARRVVELLREKRWEEWKRAQEHAETAALDELAVMSAARRSD